MAQQSSSSAALGDAIRTYRRRRLQIHNGAPWSQEDLGVAIGSDKSHVNRIERGHSMPTQGTLERLCAALQLSWPERANLFGLAGYLIGAPEPTVDDIENVRGLVCPVLSAGTYGMLLQDHAMRIWDINQTYASAFLGFRDRESCLAHIRGLTVVDQVLDQRLGPWFRKVVVDYEGFVRRALTRYLCAYRNRLAEPAMALTVGRILRDPHCGPIWNELNQRPEAAADLFLDHQSVKIDHPSLGEYGVWIWHSTLAYDDRFFLSHHIPSDSRSQSLMEGVALRAYAEENRRRQPPA